MLIGSFQESPKSGGQDPNLWTVDDVMQYIRDIDPLLAPHADLFRKHVSLSLNLDLALFYCFYICQITCRLARNINIRSTFSSLRPLQEIDGKALLLLRSDMMMKYMGLKLGPALKLTFHIDKLKRA